MKVKKLKIDFSTWMNYKRCPRSFFHEYLQGFREEGFSEALSFGSCLHEGLEAFHSGGFTCSPPDSLQAELEVLLDPSEPPTGNTPLDRIKQTYQALKHSKDLSGVTSPNAKENTMDRYSREHALWLMFRYIENWQGVDSFKAYEHKGTKMIEQFVELPVTDKLTFCGTFDGLIQNGKPALLEHKTAGSLWNFSDKARLSLQGTGYVALAQSLGIDVNQVMFNGLKTQWGKTDKTLFNNPPKNFARNIVQVPSWRIDEWRSMLIQDTNRIIEDIEAESFTMTAPEACLAYMKLCKFNDICTAKPANRQWFLEAKFDKSTWRGFHLETE